MSNSSEPPDTHNNVKDGLFQSQVHQRRIEHATTATIEMSVTPRSTPYRVAPTKMIPLQQQTLYTAECLMQSKRSAVPL